MLTKNNSLSLDIAKITHKAKSLGANLALKAMIAAMQEQQIPEWQILRIIASVDEKLAAEKLEV